MSASKNKNGNLEEKVFANHESGKGLISRVYIERTPGVQQQTENPIKKWGKELE
jgi:hypothetical protein